MLGLGIGIADPHGQAADDCQTDRVCALHFRLQCVLVNHFDDTFGLGTGGDGAGLCSDMSYLTKNFTLIQDTHIQSQPGLDCHLSTVYQKHISTLLIY